jgi:hypothetical protein
MNFFECALSRLLFTGKPWFTSIYIDFKHVFS